MNFSIQQKLFFLLSGITIMVLVVVLVAVNSTVSSTVTEDILANFRQTQGFFQIEQSLRYDRLVESAYLIQENSTFKANVELDDAPSVNYVVNQFAGFIKADLFVVTNYQGQVLSWLGKPDKTGSDLNINRETVAEALKGQEPPLNIRWPDLWAENGLLYQVVTIPIFSGQANSIIGTVTLGSELSTDDAKELMQNTPLEVVFFLDNQPIAASSNNYPKDDYQSFVSDKQALIDSLLNNRIISKPVIEEIGSTEHFSFISPLGNGENAYYVASVPKAQELSILSTIQRNILLIALLAVLIIIPLAIFLGRILSRPLNKLTNAMTRVEEGNFDVNLVPRSKDEIGRMTKSFNKMVGGLKERFALQKYVGSHTMHMIESMSGEGDVKLGGQKTDLAILFTDIRGSTKTIESTDPEVFVDELNALLSQQSQIVVDHNGSIDKYVGDSIIALFSGKNALHQAVTCSVAMQQNYNESIKNKKPFFGGLGIGVNYGPVVLGNMGGDQRMDYTVIGPEVNLCARLCDVAKPGQILIPEYLLKKFNITAYKTSNAMDKELKGFSSKIKVAEIIYD